MVKEEPSADTAQTHSLKQFSCWESICVLVQAVAGNLRTISVHFGTIQRLDVVRVTEIKYKH